MSICCRAGAWGQNAKFSGFSILATPTIDVISIFRRRASRLTGNTLIKPNYASVSQSRHSLDRDRHNVTKKVAAAPCSETSWAKKLEKFRETCFGTLLCLWIWCKSIKNWRRYTRKKRCNGQRGNCNVSVGRYNSGSIQSNKSAVCIGVLDSMTVAL